MLCAVLLKKLSQTKDLWDIYSSTQRKKWQIVWWKQQLSYCFPKKPAKLFCVQITVLEAEWHIAWFAGASINIFFFYCCSHWHCHRHVVTCAGVPAHQMAVVTNPPPPHMHSLPHMMWHNDWLGGGPHACKCYCPRRILNLVCAS